MKQSKLIPIILSSLILVAGESYIQKHYSGISLSENQTKIRGQDFYFSGKRNLDLQKTEVDYRV